MPAPLLVVMALPAESNGVLEAAGVPVTYCGVGKVNAALVLARVLAGRAHAGLPMPYVLNFGTAGSRTLPTGSLVTCTTFVQRDMDVTALGFPLGVTPYEDHPAELSFPPLFPELPRACCGSGDSFATTSIALACDVLDMEAYALAKVCHVAGVPFASAKFVSDGADHGAAGDWQANVNRAAHAFLDLYRDAARRLSAPA